MVVYSYGVIDLQAAMTVTVPQGTSGSVAVTRFAVSAAEATLAASKEARYGRYVHTGAGTYTGLFRRGGLWMSDTPSEQRDHYKFLHQAMNRRARRVLVTGLGLGMVAAALLHMDHVEHIDIVEIDDDVIALVEPHYQTLAAQAGKTLTVHHGDAYTITWPKDVRWDVAWHDVWRDLCTDNLAHMATLHRRYGRRVGWQDSWSKPLLLAQRAREQRSPAHRLGW